jgi:FAD/FMN-containing dehydrogenase
VTFRGAGHATSGQAVSDGGILVDNNGPRAATEILFREDASVEVPSRTRWVDLEHYLNAKGRTSPVLTDYLDLSVGGTLSVGGYGVRGIRNGSQLDHVSSARLVLPNGEQVWSSPWERPELFSYALASAGALAYIDRVVLRTLPLVEDVRLRTFEHASFEALLDGMAWMPEWTSGWPSQFDATWFQRKGLITSRYGDGDDLACERIFSTPAFRDSRAVLVEDQVYRHYHMLNHAHVAAWAQSFGAQHKLWTDYVLDLDGLRSVLRFLRAAKRLFPARDYLECLYVVGIKRLPDRCTFAFEGSGHRSSAMEYLLGVYFMFPRGDDRALTEVRQAIGQCLELCLAAHGRPYLHGWHELSSAHLESFYGADLHAFWQLKRSLDPEGTLPATIFRGERGAP